MAKNCSVNTGVGMWNGKCQSRLLQLMYICCLWGTMIWSWASNGYIRGYHLELWDVYYVICSGWKTIYAERRMFWHAREYSQFPDSKYQDWYEQHKSLMQHCGFMLQQNHSLVWLKKSKANGQQWMSSCRSMKMSLKSLKAYLQEDNMITKFPSNLEQYQSTVGLTSMLLRKRLW